MSQLIQAGHEYIELKDDSTFVRHKVQIIQQGNHILRINTDETGVETPVFIAPKRLMTLEKATGNIIQEQRGFIIDHEILGPPTHADPTKEFVHILESDFPDDYETVDDITKVRTINYKYDKISKKLVLN